MSDQVILALIAAVATAVPIVFTFLLTAAGLWLKMRENATLTKETAALALTASEKAKDANTAAVAANVKAVADSESNAAGIEGVHRLVNSQRDTLLAKMESLESKLAFLEKINKLQEEQLQAKQPVQTPVS